MNRNFIVFLTLIGIAAAVCPSNCLSCSDPTFYTCNNGFYLATNNRCRSCPIGCQACSSRTFCTICTSGYYLASNNTCQICSGNCQSCSSFSYCLTCYTGLYLNGTQCIPCSTICSTCANSSCSSCISGYYLNNGQCASCPSMCISCKSSTICTNCSYPYYLNSTSCTSCQANCYSCLNSTYCYSCKYGTYLDTNQCFNCPQTCYSCTSSNNCSICNLGFYQSAGQCLTLCPAACKTCETTNFTACVACNDGYILSNKSCLSCPSYCLNCSNNDCQGCASGNYLSNNYCQPCISNCYSCSNNSSCNTCSSDYQISVQNSTQICLMGSSSTGLLILLPIFTSIISFAFLVGCIYWLKCRNRGEQAVDGAESMERIGPINFQWKQYKRIQNWQDQTCPICLEASLEVETNCKHLYHLKCLMGWCGRRNTCPSCRQIVGELKFMCLDCKNNYVNVKLEQARLLRDNKCGECEAANSKMMLAIGYDD